MREPLARFQLLRRATIVLSVGSIALAGALYLQVSGALAGVGDAVLGSAPAADPSTSGQGGGGGFAPAPQAAPANPGFDSGQPVVRTGGS
ncbi:MAG: hypothetical protein E6J29_01005 [Chloroflexi bacterium]|nr:MAG: hypothetical protein E6J29_01005 [Chloroflexota bacterium]